MASASASYHTILHLPNPIHCHHLHISPARSRRRRCLALSSAATHLPDPNAAALSRFSPVRRASAGPLAFETEEDGAQSADEDDEQEWAGGIGAVAHREEEHDGDELAGEDEGADDLSGWTQRQPRPCELFVCNLPRRCGVDELVELFGPFGTVLSVELNIARTLYIGKPKKKGGKPGKAFNLFHCWSILGEEEKWKNRSSNEIPNKRKATLVGEGFELDTDDEGSSSPTPRKRPEGRKKAKDARAKGGENMYKESLDNMMTVRKELAKERREVKNKEIEERKLVEERKVLAEERKAAAEEKRVELEERKLANEEMLKRMEQEQKLMFMDPSTLDEKGRAYWELCRDQILMARGYVGGHGGGNGGGGGDGGNGGGDM